MFGESHIDEIAAENGIEVLGKIPMIPEIAALCDAGNIEDVAQEYIPAADSIFEE